MLFDGCYDAGDGWSYCCKNNKRPGTARCKTIPIIAMTANAFREDAERCMEAGMNAHLAKPLDDEKLSRP